MDVLSNNSLLMLEKSMGYLWTKQAAILDNIANAETPNYKAKNVTFEEKFRKQLENAARSKSGSKTQVRRLLENANFAVEQPLETTRMDDNGVNVTEQSAELMRNAIQIQYVMQAISNNLSNLRTAISGQ